MQIRINTWTACLMMCLFVLTGFGLSSCEKEKIDTKIILNSFGPSPALRGGELRFIGNNLEKVTSIILPGLKEGQTVEVTEITVIDEREIRITIPQDAGVGLLTLKTPEGDITTITPLTYSEPISIESVTPATIKAGQTLTITGDYLNLIKSIIFFDGIAVGDTAFVSQTRKKIEVKVPAEAQTGKIILSNGAEIPIEVYSKDPLNIVLPTFTSFTPTTIKPGAVLTITGKDLDLVSMVEFGGGKIIPAFTLSSDGTKINITVPEDAQEGIIKLIAKSGVYVEGIADLKLVMPSNLAVVPTTVKNKETMTISGTNLDLVSSVMFGDLEAEILEKSATKIILTVPETASAKTATLNTLSTMTVETPEFAYVVPTIKTMTPETIMAGTDLTITGTNLDLVKQARFTGSSKIVDITPAPATSMIVTVPTDALTGVVTLITMNGTEVVSSSPLTVTAADIPVVTKMPASIKPGQLLVIEGTKLNLVETVIFANGVKATNFGIRSATLLEVYVPEEAAKGVNEIQFVTFTGKIIKETITISGTDPVINTALVFFDFDAGDASIGWNDVGSVVGDTNKYYHVDADMDGGWKVYFMRNWGKFSTSGITASDVIKLDINIKGVDPAIVLKFRMKGSEGDFWYIWKVGELYPQGTSDWITVKIPLSSFKDSDGAGTNTITDPSKLGGEYGIAHGWGAGHITMSVDNVRFEQITTP